MPTDPFGDLLARAARVQAQSSDFDLNPDRPKTDPSLLRPAAVLLPFEQRADGLHLYLTKRSAGLRHHPGQIAFPGGKVDATDSGPEDTALREAQEEIALPRENVELLARLPAHETVTGFVITPIIARITAPFDPVPEPGEVDEIFTVPYRAVSDPARFSVQSRLWRGRRRYYYTVPHGPWYIWGATARILRALAEAAP